MKLDIVAAGSTEKEKWRDYSAGRYDDKDQRRAPRHRRLQKRVLLARISCAGCRDVNDNAASKMNFRIQKEVLQTPDPHQIGNIRTSGLITRRAAPDTLP